MTSNGLAYDLHRAKDVIEGKMWLDGEHDSEGEAGQEGHEVDERKFAEQFRTLFGSEIRNTGNTISIRLLGRSRLKSCLGPGYFLMQSSDCMLETEGPWALLTPVKAIRVGVGI